MTRTWRERKSVRLQVDVLNKDFMKILLALNHMTGPTLVPSTVNGMSYSILISMSHCDCHPDYSWNIEIRSIINIRRCRGNMKCNCFDIRMLLSYRRVCYRTVSVWKTSRRLPDNTTYAPRKCMRVRFSFWRPTGYATVQSVGLVTEITLMWSGCDRHLMTSEAHFVPDVSSGQFPPSPLFTRRTR